MQLHAQFEGFGSDFQKVVSKSLGIPTTDINMCLVGSLKWSQRGAE